MGDRQGAAGLEDEVIYTKYIKGREDWEFAGMYTDEGVTGTSTKKREGFTRMIKDALDGKIQLIITKSVSRFARNTVDCLTTIRKLKAAGVEVYFEKEGIWTLDSAGELLITVLSSISQEEARSISENTTWGHWKRFLGYDRGEDGNLVINLEQAKTVKLIYKLFLTGLSYKAICRELMARGIKSPAGKDNWNAGAVKSILTNEKMKGNALLQKQFNVDFLTKKHKKNEGEIPQYYVTGNHEAIIPPTTFDLVQAEIERREKFSRRYSGVSIFSSKIKCGECGSWYGAKVWHSNEKYRKKVYRCNHKYRYDKWCSTPAVTEEEIKKWFLKALDSMLTEKEEVICNLNMLRRKTEMTDLIAEQEKVRDEIARLDEDLRKMIADNASVAQSQDEYDRNYAVLYGKYEQKLVRADEIAAEIKKQEVLGLKIDGFIEKISNLEAGNSEFDENLWAGIVDYLTVYTKEKVVITFVGGIEIEVEG